MFASNATVRKLYGNRRGISGELSRDALSRICSMLIDIHRVAHGVPRLTGCGKTISALQNFDGLDVWDKPSLTGLSGPSGLSG